MSARRRTPTVLPLAFVACATSLAASDWPQFRGPNGSGVPTTPATPPVSWNVQKAASIGWQAPIAGLAHSSPIIWGDRIYLTTAVSEQANPSIVTGDSSKGGVSPAADAGRYSWRLLAIDKNTGRIAWDKVAYQGVPRMKRHVKASHASATPATNGRVIVALMGSEGLFCFDMSGAQKWRTDLGVMDVGLVDDPALQWGPASSPVILDDMVLVQNDRHKESFLAAYDINTGKERWRAAHDEYPSWATPAVIRSGGRAQIVTNSGKHIRGFEPATGKELWRLADNNTQVKVPTPIAAGDAVIVTGGYPPGGRPIYSIRLGDSGELTDKALNWKTDRGAPYTGTPIVYEGILYALTDNGILSAYDPASGTRIYQERIAAGSGFSASPVAADGRLYLSSEDGDVLVVQAGRTYKLLATNSMAEPIMATPAVSGNSIFIRTLTKLVAVR